MVGLVMAVIAFVLEDGHAQHPQGRQVEASTEELHTTLTSKGGEVDLTDARPRLRIRSTSSARSRPAEITPKATGTHLATRSEDTAVSAVARIAAPAVSEIARRRPARRIVVSSDAARKFTSSFCPGRAPIRRSIASTTFSKRTLNRWA